MWVQPLRPPAAELAQLLGGPMSVHRSASGKGGRQGSVGDPGVVPQATSRGQLRVGLSGQRPGDLSAGLVGGPGRRAAQPPAWTGPARPRSYLVSDVRSIRTRRPGPDQPAARTAPAGGNRDSVDGGGD